MSNSQTAFDIDELYFKANNDMAVILNMVRIASLSKKKKGKLLAAIEQKILDTMGGLPTASRLGSTTSHATTTRLLRPSSSVRTRPATRVRASRFLTGRTVRASTGSTRSSIVTTS